MKPDLDRYRSYLKSRRYPVWSVRSAVIYFVVVAGISALVAGFIPDLNIFLRMELALGIVAIAIFWFMTVGLYRGARLKKNDLPVMRFQGTSSAEEAAQTGVDIGADLALDAGGDDFGCLGIITGLVIWLVMLLVGGLVIWALVQLGGWLIVGFIFGLSWVVYRALRQVFARSRQCQGKLLPSLSWAMIYTAIYTTWLFALLLLGSWLTNPP